MIEWTAGDIFAATDLPALGHGCNCAGAMGKGIAVEFKRRWPTMYDEYRRRCKDGRFKPGDVLVWDEPDRTIFNLATEKTWRTGATLEAIEGALTEMVRIADERRIERIGLPRLGAGLGGLEWDAVRKVIERVGAPARATLVVFETFVPATPGKAKPGGRPRSTRASGGS